MDKNSSCVRRDVGFVLSLFFYSLKERFSFENKIIQQSTLYRSQGNACV